MNNLTFLVVDDDPAIRGFMHRCLTSAGAKKILLATTGEEGLALAQAEKPDLVILDIRLPSANGLHILRRIKESPSTAGIPILIATGEVEFRPVCDENHAGAILSKPFTERQLIVQIKQLLHLNSTVAGAELAHAGH